MNTFDTGDNSWKSTPEELEHNKEIEAMNQTPVVSISPSRVLILIGFIVVGVIIFVLGIQYLRKGDYLSGFGCWFASGGFIVGGFFQLRHPKKNIS